MGRGAGVKITHEEWIKELDRLAQVSEPREGLTLAAIMSHTGKGRKAVVDMLTRAKAEGRLVTFRKPVEAIDGTMRPVPHYTIKRRSTQA